jgi:oligopeptide transport system substrate-binding protein
VKAVDDYTFEVQLEKAVLLRQHALPTTTYPVPKKVIEKFGDSGPSPATWYPTAPMC